MTDTLMMAILAMDSYNRGYDEKIPNLGGTGSDIGNYTLNTISTLKDTSEEVEEGFFAAYYTSSTNNVISDRGTDSFLDDIDDWFGGIGYQTDQSDFAVAFYEGVVKKINEDLEENIDLYNSNITFTGHSLGGGLAGLMGSLYHQEAYIFDNMPFELSTARTYDASTPDSLDFLKEIAEFLLNDYILGENQPFDADVKETYYPDNIDVKVPNREQIKAIAVKDEVLQLSRGSQQTPVKTLNPYLDDPNLLIGSPDQIDLHSQALLVALLYAQEKEPDSFWKEISLPLIRTLFNDDFAEGISGESEDAADKMLIRIAYSAIAEGEKPFGDTALPALFDDGNDLGKASLVVNNTDIVGRYGETISQLFVEYAARLAFSSSIIKDNKNGILTLGQNDDGKISNLALDVSQETWEPLLNIMNDDVPANKASLIDAILDDIDLPSITDIGHLILATDHDDKMFATLQPTQEAALFIGVYRGEGNDTLSGAANVTYTLENDYVRAKTDDLSTDEGIINAYLVDINSIEVEFDNTLIIANENLLNDNITFSGYPAILASTAMKIDASSRTDNGIYAKIGADNNGVLGVEGFIRDIGGSEPKISFDYVSVNIHGTQSDDYIENPNGVGNDGNDYLIGNTHHGILRGGNGSDVLIGGGHRYGQPDSGFSDHLFGVNIISENNGIRFEDDNARDFLIVGNSLDNIDPTLSPSGAARIYAGNNDVILRNGDSPLSGVNVLLDGNFISIPLLTSWYENNGVAPEMFVNLTSGQFAHDRNDSSTIPYNNYYYSVSRYTLSQPTNFMVESYNQLFVESTANSPINSPVFPNYPTVSPIDNSKAIEVTQLKYADGIVLLYNYVGEEANGVFIRNADSSPITHEGENKRIAWADEFGRQIGSARISYNDLIYGNNKTPEILEEHPDILATYNQQIARWDTLMEENHHLLHEAVPAPFEETTPEIRGTDDPELITGTNADEEIFALMGNDTVTGGGGNDSILAGSQDDDVNGGSGDDYISGYHGNDTLDGGTGNDRIHGGIGNDEIMGDDGRDSVYAGEGDDSVLGGADDDHLRGEEGNDTLSGGLGRDTLEGGDGLDIFVFESTDDSIQKGGDDGVRDFTVGMDLLDVSLLGFTGLDTDGGKTEEGEFRLAYSERTDRTYIRSDQSDFEFFLNGDFRDTLTDADFIFA